MLHYRSRRDAVEQASRVSRGREPRYVGGGDPLYSLAAGGVVGALAMMIDGVALRWFPGVYGSDPVVLRLGAAWLLWGYGVSLGIAVIMAARQVTRRLRITSIRPM